MPQQNILTPQLETLLELKKIDYFHKASTYQSLRNAAAHEGIAQSALSRQLQALEQELGVTLFDRTPSGVQITPAGKRLRQLTEPLLSAVNEAQLSMKRFRNVPAGQVKLAIPATLSSFLLPPLFQLFASDLHKTNLSIVEGSARHIEQWLKTGEVDIGIIVGPSHDPRINAEHLYIEDLYLMCKTKPAWLNEDHAEFTKLAELPLVLPLMPLGSRQILEHMAEKMGIKLSPVVEVDSPNIQKHLVLEHGMYGIFSRLVCKAELNAGDMHAIPIRPAPQRSFFIATREGARLSQAARLLSPILRRVAFSLR